MNEMEYIEYDRITKIQQVINKYGIENFCISYSGGKDSTVLSQLIDLALPDNRIPRVYCNTGIEYKLMVDYVKQQQINDDRIVIIQPKVPIIPTLNENGYPFKSKQHSRLVNGYRNSGMITSVANYISGKSSHFSCPKILKYQFTEENKLKISDKCCKEMKEKPIIQWARDNGYKYHIIGIRASEGGRRATAKCLVFKDDILRTFQPLAPINADFIEWFIAKHNIKLCELYYYPYNFERTGCKGCPFNINIQQELDIMREKMPIEAKHCEKIWKPVYSEYRRLGYRLRKDDGQISFFDSE